MPSANFLAAIMGPTVCELDGPIPILKRSKTLIAIMSHDIDHGLDLAVIVSIQ